MTELGREDPEVRRSKDDSLRDRDVSTVLFDPGPFSREAGSGTTTSKQDRSSTLPPQDERREFGQEPGPPGRL
jgi:hypothetical protein